MDDEGLDDTDGAGVDDGEFWDAIGDAMESGDPAGAADARRESLRYRRICAQAGEPSPYRQWTLARSLSRLGEALAAAGDPEGARTARRECDAARRGPRLPRAGRH